ncbi:MAG: hypothetical protein Q7T05_07140 [Dehalococcoidia bacterium]|nr:hypothetical protein [Dehalococcoidia bacterium]
MPKWLNNAVSRVVTNGVKALQTTLDVAGLVPGIGEAADAVNGVIYLAQGDKLKAGISFAACIPIIGWGATIGKYGRKAGNIVDSLRGAKTWGLPGTLAEHFGEHGADFGARNADEYAQMASDFLKRSQADKLPTKIDANGTIRVYDPETNTFGSYNPDGTTKTFYKPDPSMHGKENNWEYWEGKMETVHGPHE